MLNTKINIFLEIHPVPYNNHIKIDSKMFLHFVYEIYRLIFKE